MKENQNSKNTLFRRIITKLGFNNFRRLTIILGFAVVLVFVTWVGVHQTSSSSFCASCHNMTPELNTWQASSHSQVECVSCHIPPGPVNFIKKKAKGLIQVYDTVTDEYGAPIIQADPIPNSACERCHNMHTRRVTASGDIIIPHDKHMKQGVYCTACHSGVAHGNIAKRKVTYKSDYDKWDPSIGKSMMSDRKYVGPQMDTCMKCHQLRKAPLECKACHTSEMKPDSHKDPTFKNGNHGKLAAQYLKDCNTCHQYTTSKPVEGFQEVPTYQKVLDQGKAKPAVTPQTYTKVNEFCKKCHGIKPESHKQANFSVTHGTFANQDKTRCMTCHDNNINSSDAATKVACASCHPSTHSRNPDWRAKHPISVPEKSGVSQLCYTCHNTRICSSCHVGTNKG